jgi:hypothetical protein
VDHDSHEKDNPCNPKRRPKLTKKRGVSIDVIRVLEHLQITHQVAHDEADQDQARDGHEYFPADRRAKKGADQIHAGFRRGEWKRKTRRNSTSAPPK